MMLIEVLDQFPTEINERIESIGYDDDPGTFKLSAFFYNDIDDPIKVDIVLFTGGESMLYVEKGWLYDDAVDFYIKVKEIWKNVG